MSKIPKFYATRGDLQYDQLTVKIRNVSSQFVATAEPNS